MNNIIPAQPYPIDAFHLLVRDAAFEIANNTQAPMALIGMELLSNMSASAQGLYDVKLPTGKVSPVSLNCMIVAESGERMSGVHSVVAKPLYEFDQERTTKYQHDAQEYEHQIRAWNVVNQGLSRKLSKAAELGEGLDEAQTELLAWAKQMPVKPRARRIMRQNITERAIMDALEGDGEVVSFISDEGELIIKGGALNNMGTMNKAWDGADMLTLDRSNGVSVVARQPRVSLSFKAQPKVLNDLMNRRGDLMRGSGHWARYLVGSPPSTQGMRISFQLDRTWTKVAAFHERMRELLSEFGVRVDEGVVDRTVLEFSPEAKEEWLHMANFIEQQLGPMGYLHDIKDFASKTMEIMGRVAALLHIYSKQEGLISVDTVQRAFKIVEWHLHEFKRLFSPEVPVVQAQIDVQKLSDYLFRLRTQTNSTIIAKNFVLQNGPLRPSKRFEDALGILQMSDHVRVVPGHRKQRFIHLNAQIFGGPMQTGGH